ncbi:GpE family phage tail protein [Novosphingobium sp. KACC 22771]|nr:GpE family phage tail protein [Novosphingobium sp. KACC 22771]WDF74147.1 GpE family phage tail protein [Novosphingobium sp. KACC 22771]
MAAIFHWPKETLDAMALDELLGWRERAISRWNRMQGQE